MSGQDCTGDASKLTDEDLVDVNRSRLYKLLALGFGFPCKELHAAQAELRDIAAALYPDLELNQGKTHRPAGPGNRVACTSM